MKKAWSVALAVGLLAACRIPDLKPFSDATTEMATVLKQGLEQARSALGAAADTADDQDAFKKQVAALDEQWRPTRRAVSALVSYSDSLSALAESGKRGPEVVARLTGAVKDLASVVGAMPLAGVAERVANAVGSKIIEMQAARGIASAVGKATEAVDIMAPLLVDNFVDLRRIHGASSAAWESRVLGQSSILTGYHESLAGEEQRLQYLLNLIVEYQSAPARLRWRAALARAEGREEFARRLEGSIAQEQQDQLKRLQESDSAFEAIDLRAPEAAARVEARQLHLMNLLNAHRAEIALLAPKYQQAMAELARVREARRTGDRLLERAGGAITAWQRAHHSLQAVMLGQQRRPSISDLLSITREMAAFLN